MGNKKGSLSINSENIFPIIKKWLYSDHDIFLRELVSNACDAITKLRKLDMIGEFEEPEDNHYRVDVKVSPENKTIKVYKDHIEKGSHLIHDDENSHQILVDELNLTDECFASSYLKTLKDEDNPLYPLNRIHFLLKDFLGQHSGFDRSELQGYLDLFTFIMNPPHDNLEKVKILIELAINTKKRLKYREYYTKKDLY